MTEEQKLKCENCNKNIKGKAKYGYGLDKKYRWCSRKCADKGLKRLAREKMTDEERKFFEWVDTLK